MSSILFNCVIYYVNHLLKSKVNVLKTRARALGYELDVHSCAHDLALLRNTSNDKMGAIGSIIKKTGEDRTVKFECFLIDVNKYNWAKLEGFSQDDIYDPNGELRGMNIKVVQYDSIAAGLQ